METDLAEHGGMEEEMHPGAVGTAEGDPPSPEASIDEVEHLLDQVEEALSRLDDGTYGRCGACGGVIEDAPPG